MQYFRPFHRPCWPLPGAPAPGAPAPGSPVHGVPVHGAPVPGAPAHGAPVGVNHSDSMQNTNVRVHVRKQNARITFRTPNPLFSAHLDASGRVQTRPDRVRTRHSVQLNLQCNAYRLTPPLDIQQM
jgi:hypothetical protein